MAVTAALVSAISDHSDYAIEYTVHSPPPGKEPLKVKVPFRHEQLEAFLDDKQSSARDSLWLIVKAILEHAFRANLKIEDVSVIHLLSLAQAAEVTVGPYTY